MLCHFGFDWLAICTRRIPNDEESTELKELDTGHGKNKWIVRRRLCTAAAIKLNSTSALSRSCPSGWESGNVLLHRRTLVLFNQLHSKGDGLDFKAWLSSPTLWTVSKLSNVTEDTQSTAIIFIYRLLNQIWGRVISEWKHIVDQCFEHIRTSEIKALDKGINVNGLEELAQKTWRDSLDWATLTQLLSAQKRTVSRAQEYLTRLAREVKVDSAVEDARLTQIVNDLSEVEKIISEDFPQREQRISDLVYNIIGVRNAQAAEEYNSQIGAVTWITFIFFPLIAVAGMFGMNVDVLADNPSIKWIWIKKVILPGRRAKR
ncbi:hypothetical protein EJ04DRAFT_264762 [Polyplosphaeria fusca]|uniref:Uncharacterized protein n=1 Tax=Polyplosphaeria fusca TaxID=682080 RepID=A0A9P4V4Y4_9PLEO|nr:hypothetical protein EJ04DRAFT_264762 [Polyplosphaeria fusca]